jgi:hypothetical protein
MSVEPMMKGSEGSEVKMGDGREKVLFDGLVQCLY